MSTPLTHTQEACVWLQWHLGRYASPIDSHDKKKIKKSNSPLWVSARHHTHTNILDIWILKQCVWTCALLFVFHWLSLPAHFFSLVQPKCRLVIYSLSLKARLDWQISMISLCLPGFGMSDALSHAGWEWKLM